MHIPRIKYNFLYTSQLLPLGANLSYTIPMKCELFVVIMWQTMEKSKGYEYFCTFLYFLAVSFIGQQDNIYKCKVHFHTPFLLFQSWSKGLDIKNSSFLFWVSLLNFVIRISSPAEAFSCKMFPSLSFCCKCWSFKSQIRKNAILERDLILNKSLLVLMFMLFTLAAA